MTRDFARKGRKSSKPGPGASRKTAAPLTSPPWVWFLTGLVCGVFLCGLTWLAFQQEDAGPGETALAPTAPEAQRPEPRFDFYTLLPEQRVEIDLDPETIATASPAARPDRYLLQAGSFKQAEDADRRRAQLLLLGLDAHVEEASGDNGRWFRVYIGPFDSRSKLAHARGLTAQQGIDTLLLKRPVESGN
jgi:cell division septation protein DedD